MTIFNEQEIFGRFGVSAKDTLAAAIHPISGEVCATHGEHEHYVRFTQVNPAQTFCMLCIEDDLRRLSAAPSEQAA